MAKEVQPVETWIIKHKETGQILTVPSGKSSWKKPGHAKNAWNTLNRWYVERHKLDVPLKSEYRKYLEREVHYVPKFDDQDIWVLVKLEHESVSKLEKAEQILKMCLGRVDHNVQIMIEEYFNGS